jgi:hypothetical protein
MAERECRDPFQGMKLVKNEVVEKEHSGTPER